jgi:hypothetical protein
MFNLKQIEDMHGLLPGISGTHTQTASKEIPEGSLPSQAASMTYKDIVLRNQRMWQERAISNTKNAGSSMPTATVDSKDDATSEAINETGSSDSRVDGFVVVTRKKRREVEMATPPVNPKQSKNTEPP